MSVLIETSAGDIVVDLLVEYVPKLCENFLKLCKLKYYNFSPIHSIQKDFSFQTGDPLGPLSTDSDGGACIWGLLSCQSSGRTFPASFHPKLKHAERGTVSMATMPLASDPDTKLAASQFLITLSDNTDYLDGRGAVFGKVAEGFDTLDKINSAITDGDGHPLADIRIKHTIVLDDPYPDPDGFKEPSASPLPAAAQLATVRIGDDVDLEDLEENDPEDAERRRREQQARKQALTLEMMGDLPFAEVKPPENVLFVCKLNPVTTDEDLELIFSRFGKILSCEVIRDRKTGDSLQYAFVEFEEKEQCEMAYFKMNDVLIDDRRIHVDFSQSVSKLSDAWRSETNQKRAARSRGGWGGVTELEKWRKYRKEDEEDVSKGYDMIHSVEDMRARLIRNTSPGNDKTVGRDRRRSRSPRPLREGRERDHSRDRVYHHRKERDQDLFRRGSPSNMPGQDRKKDGRCGRDRGRRRNKYDGYQDGIRREQGLRQDDRDHLDRARRLHWKKDGDRKVRERDDGRDVHEEYRRRR